MATESVATNYEDHLTIETPFLETASAEAEDGNGRREAEAAISLPAFEMETPFLSSESSSEVSEAAIPEVAAFAEMLAELPDPQFRESLEALADEALEANADRLENQFGDRETLSGSAERLLNEHFHPLAQQTESSLDRFFEQLEGYEAEQLTEAEIERLVSEAMSSGTSISPASEQFLSGLLRKAGKLASGAVRFAKRGIEGAVKLAGKGLASIGKFAFGPILQGLKKLGRFLLQHVVRFALNRLPPAVRPMARKLSERLFRAIGETMAEAAFEQGENEGFQSAPDAARLESEFDVQAAQLLLVPAEAETEQLISQFGEAETAGEAPQATLDRARTELIDSLGRLHPGDNPKPALEQFIPVALLALRPLARTAIGMIGRDKVVGFLANLISGLIRPIVGAEFTRILAPAVVDAGLTLLGFETAEMEPREVGAEALAATIEQTLASVAGLPDHVLENETLLEDATREAFENAAATYFPTGVIRSELRQTADVAGMWVRLPKGKRGKRYAKYTRSFPVTITPKLARSIRTFQSATLADFFRDRYGLAPNQVVKGRIALYKALYGTRGSTIARAERFSSAELHPLTLEAAGALLGPNAGLGAAPSSDIYLANPQALQIGQRLYRIELPQLRPRGGKASTALLVINLRTAEIRAWLYLSEAHCQQISKELAKGRSVGTAVALVKPLITRIVDAVWVAVRTRRLPPNIRIISETPQLESEVPPWLIHAAKEIALQIARWLLQQIAAYLQAKADEFRRVCASRQDGVTLRITMRRVPGMDNIRLLQQGKLAQALLRPGWMHGVPDFELVTLPGYAVGR